MILRSKRNGQGGRNSLEPGVKGRQEVECPLEGTVERSRDLGGITEGRQGGRIERV